MVRIPVVLGDMTKRLPLNIFGDFIAFLITLRLGVNAFPQGFAVLTDFFTASATPTAGEDAEGNGIRLPPELG